MRDGGEGVRRGARRVQRQGASTADDRRTARLRFERLALSRLDQRIVQRHVAKEGIQRRDAVQAAIRL